MQTEAYVSETQRAAQAGHLRFRFASLWEPAVINPINGKSFTLPMFRFWDPYSIAFWMATLGFFSAFFSWFAFAPLVTEAVKQDLMLTPTRECCSRYLHKRNVSKFSHFLLIPQKS